MTQLQLLLQKDKIHGSCRLPENNGHIQPQQQAYKPNIRCAHVRLHILVADPVRIYEQVRLADNDEHFVHDLDPIFEYRNQRRMVALVH